MKERHYPAKLLLYGEYTVLSGSQALAIPVLNWSSRWTIDKDITQLYEAETNVYIHWLIEKNLLPPQTKRIIADNADNNWKYDSNIPIGHGLGSSGAFVAALYDKFGVEKETDPRKLMKILAEMESWFHGSSSGLDPLVSYLAMPVLRNDQGSYIPVDCGRPEHCFVYVWDSGKMRKTAPLVAHYKELLNNIDFSQKVNNALIPYVEHAIHYYLAGQTQEMFLCLEQISKFQRLYFKDFIPENAREKWDEISSEGHGFMKLCGAGGGGEFLVFLRNRSNDPSLIEVEFQV